MAVVTDIADAVVTSLNSPGEPGFSQPFTAERLYQPTFELADMETLQVSVVPRTVTITSASRNASFHDCAVDIGVQKKVNPENRVELDGLLNLVEELADHLRHKRLDAYPEAGWLSIEHEPLFAPEHLDQLRQFTSVLTVTYRVPR